MIDDAQGQGEGGTLPFHLWPAQLRVFYQLMTERLVIILKARQLGISWLCCWYALWLCLWHPGKVVLLFSKSQGEANELARRILVLYDRLPDWLKELGPKLIKQNTRQLKWDNESRVLSLPATKSAGRSFTASLVILDEAAFLTWGDALYTALKPTIDGGGQLIILSTANGMGNLFHKLWTKSAAKLNEIVPIFLPWWSRPGRTAEWYAAQVKEATDPQMVKQEYPANANEAFVSTGRPRFDPAAIVAQAKHIRDGLPQSAIPAALHVIPGLIVYQPPQAGRRYILAGDVAEGLETGDYSTGTVIDAATWEEMATIHGRWEPDIYAGYLHLLSLWYGADIAVERNNHGHAVLVSLKIRRQGIAGIVNGLDGRLGWLTNAQTKPLMIDHLAAALREHLPIIHTQAVLDELQVYQILKNTSTGAPAGYHDDRVMTWAIALIVAAQPQPQDDDEYHSDAEGVSISAY